MEALQSPKWLSKTKFLQLFITTYFFLYIFPFPLEYLPFVNKVFKLYVQGIEALSIWFGKNLFGLEFIEKLNNGSGDTTFDFVKLFTISVLSLLITFVLFGLRKKVKTEKIIVFVRTYGRYFLALMLFSYGFSKFFGGQFSFPSLERLDQKIGDSSPMGLLWTFMGYSKIYTFFGGICQVLAGCLLLFRKTTVIGSLLAFAVMTNIVILNFSYDVPVKLFSTHLAAIALLLLLPNALNLFNLFFINKPTELIPEPSLIANKEKQMIVLILKIIFMTGLQLYLVVMIVKSFFYTSVQTNHLKGVYYPQEFPSGNQWKKFIINERYATVFYNENKYEDFKYKIDTVQHSIQLQSIKDTLSISRLKYQFSDKDTRMQLSGIFKKDTISEKFTIKREEDFELVKRSFNWINEYPYNK